MELTGPQKEILRHAFYTYLGKLREDYGNATLPVVQDLILAAQEETETLYRQLVEGDNE